MKFLVTTMLVLLLLVNSELGRPYTIIMSDSGGPPPSLINGPKSRTDPREQEAVYDIMRATGNDWATDIPDVCLGRWHGIECMPDKDNVFHVISLSFGALSVDTAFPTCDLSRSSISSSVTMLTHLRTLFFYRCFSDNPQPIPSFLGRLGSSLQTLVMRENGLIGPIPRELGNLTRLTILDLHRNNLNGSIPASLGRITGLTSLDLSCNRLSGPIPDITFPSLSVLDFNQNHLNGPLPIPLLSAKSLIKIDLSRNQLSGPIPNNIGTENLILLDLSYNTLTAPLPISPKNLKSLQVLILNGNPSVSTTIPENMFEGLNNLMILGLSGMKLEGTIPESLGRLTMLRVLHLDDNQLNGSIPSSFANLNGLSELRLNNNKLIGPIPFQRERVWKMGMKLRLDNNLGLCYDYKSGLGDDLDTLSGAGIGLCDAAKNGPPASVQHISTENDGEALQSSRKTSSGEKIIVSRGILGLCVLLLFVSGLF
ncbi:leucine-rich repeat receptor-like protein kinase [Striga asiatica]|uniref:Leucine-rich repeat receptor-like protein kinase n=1 Tax=Striga asiatica TaxID=4170 RepID=A0A5A7P3U9_STRAF|nr:leucine-rich repeat receptor-like protein kinase [Striga asiatica]